MAKRRHKANKPVPVDHPFKPSASPAEQAVTKLVGAVDAVNAALKEAKQFSEIAAFLQIVPGTGLNYRIYTMKVASFTMNVTTDDDGRVRVSPANGAWETMIDPSNSGRKATQA